MSAQAPAQPAAVATDGATDVVLGAERVRTRLNARAVALLLIALAVILLAIAPLRGYLDERGELKDLQRQAAVLEQQNQVLQDKVDRLSDATFLERIARECLGMVKPGETAFVVVPAHGKPNPPDC